MKTGLRETSQAFMLILNDGFVLRLDGSERQRSTWQTVSLAFSIARNDPIFKFIADCEINVLI